MSKYEANFIDQATIGFSDFHIYRPKSKVLSLDERKNKLNKKFEFSTENIIKIAKINELLQNKLLKAYDMAEVLEHMLISKMELQHHFISDYEIEFRLHLFSREKYSEIADLDGNPFFTYEPLLLYFHKWNENCTQQDIDDYNKSLKSTNYNHYPVGHPLHYQIHNLILHDLEDHTILAWQDIIDIDEVWFEVILNVQNISKVNLSST